ncbi:MAG: ferrous iron transporter B, partial [Flavobacterium sp.]
LWAMSSYGPGNRMQKVEEKYAAILQKSPADSFEIEKQKNTEILENSYAGILGKSIEPAIAPLGYDWKIGIALITSFAAREVFVGTMATLYSVGEEEGETTLRQKMHAATRSDGSRVYNLATGLSLLVFYVIAMQCMSTLAIVKRETRSWKWPVIQLVYMTALAYLLSWVTYKIFI